MSRNFLDLIKAFTDYAQHMEAPKIMHTFAMISAIGGALRRKVWIDQHYFRWTPNFFIVFVAPPGVVTKSTTVDVAMSILRDVPGIKFGPDSVTWQSLVTSFAAASEAFEYQDEWHPMSAITLASSELGLLINFLDRDMINLFIDLWDGRKSFDKQTKMSGSDKVEAPWINMIGCTTPSWIADNVPQAAIGGGFTSRCIFLYADRKEKLVPYPGDVVPKGLAEVRYRIFQDLEHISTTLCGEYILSKEAKAFGSDWYESIWSLAMSSKDPSNGTGYVARKQTHAHKLAMVLAASQRDELIITGEDLQLAITMLESLETDMHKVFSKVGRTEDSLAADKFIELVNRHGSIDYQDAYRSVHTAFPDFSVFERVLAGAIRSGQISTEIVAGGKIMLHSLNPTPLTTNII